jgi:hypothetical protein
MDLIKNGSLFGNIMPKGIFDWGNRKAGLLRKRTAQYGYWAGYTE